MVLNCRQKASRFLKIILPIIILSNHPAAPGSFCFTAAIKESDKIIMDKIIPQRPKTKIVLSNPAPDQFL